MGFGIDRRATSRKAKKGLRALLGGKAPDAREVGERVARLSRRMLRDHVIDASARRITFDFHPGAPPVRLAVLPDGDLELAGETSAVGPGYHAYVVEKLAPMLDELEYAWAGDEPDPRGAMTAWLAAELRAGATRLGMPADRAFLVDAPVLTALGPRDAAWRDAVIAEPARGADAFAWWERGPGRRARSRALLAMWLDVPWREPFAAEEQQLMERVDADLASALRADPELDLPWAAWAELLDLLDADTPHAEQVRARRGDAPAAIGYRRYPMEIEVAGGWTLELGGAFVSHEEEDGRWWATDGARAVELTALTADHETSSDALLAVAPERFPVAERVAVGDHRGRAEIHDDGDLRIVHGLMTRAPHVAILTCKGKPADEAWALATWRSLRNAG